MKELVPYVGRRSSQRDEAEILHRRALRPKHDGVQRKADSLANITNPSLLSVLSSFTNASGTSSGSNSTITQKSYDRAGISKRKRHRDRSRRVESERSSVRGQRKQSRSDSLDLFGFLGRNSEPMASLSPHTCHASPASLLDRREFPNDAGTAINDCRPRRASTSSASTKEGATERSWPQQEQIHSDSGISIGGSSPDQRIKQSPINQVPSDTHSDGSDDDSEHSDEEQESPLETSVQKKALAISSASTHEAQPAPHDDHLYHRLQSQEEELRQHISGSPYPGINHQAYHYSAQESPRVPLHHPQPQHSVPQAHFHPPPSAPPFPYETPAYHQAQFLPYAYMQPANQQHMVNVRGPDLTRTTISGYEMLASRLSQQPSAEQGKTEKHVIPMYRRFDGLNHRILLHLQDEIAEMEEELRLLDECVVQMDQMGSDCDARPASRRADARYGGEVHYRRTELLGKIFVKLGQYSKWFVLHKPTHSC